MKPIWVSAAVLILLSACFESQAPLGPPGSVAIDSHLLGTWRCHTPTMESNEIMTITVLAFDAHQLLLELKESTLVDGVEQASSSDIDRYRFYPSLVVSKSGRQILWNAQELGKTSPVWSFLRIKQSDQSTLVAQIVQDDALHGKTEQAKLNDLRKRVLDEAIYGEAISCKRVADAKSN